MTQENFSKITWTIFGLSVLLPVTVWGNSINWSLGDISLYQLFPLFGLLAWMIMWTHYVTGALRIKNPDLKKVDRYSRVSGVIVLAALLLHPGLLAYAQFKNGEGIPPGSYYSYVGEAMKLSIIIGIIGLLIFLSFEVFNRIKDKPLIKKYWWAVSLSQIVAMVLIFMHGLRLGSQLQSGWFNNVWLLYGIILLPCLYIILKNDLRTASEE